MIADRRAFLKAAAVAGAAQALHLMVPLLLPAAARAQARPDTFEPNAFIRIDRQGRVTLVMHKAEMGQGILTALAQLLAEELDVDLAGVALEHAGPDDQRYGEPLFGGLQMTGGSTSVRGAWLPLRQAGAQARALLVQAAAQRWQVDATTLQTRQGQVLDAAGARSLPYGELVAAAARLPLPAAVPLKPASAFTLIGRPTRRLDGPAKISGQAVFGIDVKRPGLKVASVAACPVFGGTLASVDRAAALKVPGVHQVLQLPDAVAVVADHTWAARQGLLAAAPTWHGGAHAGLDSARLLADLETAARGPGAVAGQTGDAAAAMAGAARRLDAVYRAPFLAHATMEPMNCTVEVRRDGVDVWVGTQVPTRAQAVAARAAGLAPAQVQVHNQLLGGGFGRRLEVDFIEQAVRFARQVTGPLKVLWSREEDMQHDLYRPYYHDTLAAGLDAAGRPVAWTHRVAGSSILARFLPPAFRDGVDGDAVEGAVDTPYRLPATRVTYVRAEPAGVPTAFWRGVGPTHNAFVVEGFVDELAAQAGIDPLAYRQALVVDPRARAVLDQAAQAAGWGTPLPPGQGRGIALLHAFGSFVAQVAQVAVAADGELRVLRVVCAVDCGVAVNPGTVAAQMEGGIVFGLSAALWGEITVADGRVQQSNFHDYRVMRMAEAPRIEVHVMPSSQAPGGVGEPGTSAAIPAVVNAVFAATGRRIRTLPIGQQLARPASAAAAGLARNDKA